MVDAVNDAASGMASAPSASRARSPPAPRAVALTRLGLFRHLGADAPAGSHSRGEALTIHRGWPWRARSCDALAAVPLPPCGGPGRLPAGWARESSGGAATAA
jgi:hypothetical protein